MFDPRDSSRYMLVVPVPVARAGGAEWGGYMCGSAGSHIQMGHCFWLPAEPLQFAWMRSNELRSITARAPRSKLAVD